MHCLVGAQDRSIKKTKHLVVSAETNREFEGFPRIVAVGAVEAADPAWDTK